MAKIRVLVVDDSAVARQVISETLSHDSHIEVLGAAADPLFALERMKKAWPDVIVLDVEMPRMDGITFLKKLMTEHPTPVVICSTLTERGAATTMEALAAGAVSIVTKPKVGLKRFLEDSATDLIGAVRAAAHANVKHLNVAHTPPLAPTPKLGTDAMLAACGPRALQETTERVVAIGASTGGTQALEALLTALPKGAPGLAIVQHMPEKFTAAFAERLNRLCAVTVSEATQGERLLPGHALIAPGGKHLLLRRNGAYYHAEVRDGPLINRHRPSVDVLFRSVAQCAGRNALGLILTGMGDDGARGMKEMLDAGAHTVAQDEASCVVFGMPKEAIRLGGAARVLPLHDMPRVIEKWGLGVAERA